MICGAYSGFAGVGNGRRGDKRGVGACNCSNSSPPKVHAALHTCTSGSQPELQINTPGQKSIRARVDWKPQSLISGNLIRFRSIKDCVRTSRVERLRKLPGSAGGILFAVFNSIVGRGGGRENARRKKEITLIPYETTQFFPHNTTRFFLPQYKKYIKKYIFICYVNIRTRKFNNSLIISIFNKPPTRWCKFKKFINN